MILLMNKYFPFSIFLVVFCASASIAQVQVSKEPYHRKVIENEYIRLLDVWLEPGDTTQLHVHSTPSLFIHMTSTNIQSQVKGKDWVAEPSTAGKIWYNSFLPDKLIHRVTNSDTETFHVIDIELLSAYDKDHQIPDVPQPYPLIMDNEKAYAYQLNSKLLKGINMVTPGPMIFILVSGGPVTFHNEMMGQSSEILKGQFTFIETGTFLSFTLADKNDVNMVLFELK